MTTENTIRFDSLDLIEPLLKSLAEEGYTSPTPIQQQAIPHILKQRDLLGCAQTGTGKTAAFALPILQILAGRPAKDRGKPKIRTLVLTPTRELAAQITESFERYGSNLGLSTAVIFGGVGQGSQVTALRKGIDILVATPGRLLDLLEQGHVSLQNLEIFVLDEADRMLDMGFIHDVRRLLKVIPRERQSLFFSATMPPDIQKLANDILSSPVKVEVTPIATTAEKIEQSVYMVDSKEGKRFLLEHLLQDPAIKRALVFTRTKHGADRVVKFLNAAKITAEAIHGNKSQNNRVRALDNFKRGDTRILVATDIAARGIDIDAVSHVINFELPNIPETYVHRIGRTARAGKEGKSLSFCDQEEREYLRDIERLIRQKIRVETDNPFAAGVYVPTKPEKTEERGPRPQQGRGRSGERRPQSGERSHGGGERSRSAAPNRGPRPERADSAPASRPARGGERSTISAFGNNSRPARDERPSRDARPSTRDARPATRDPRAGGSEARPASRDARPDKRPSSSRGPRSGSRPARASGASSGRGGASSGKGSSSDSRRGRSSQNRDASPASAGAGDKKPWWKRIVGSE